jgi:hypothetical protein
MVRVPLDYVVDDVETLLCVLSGSGVEWVTDLDNSSRIRLPAWKGMV